MVAAVTYVTRARAYNIAATQQPGHLSNTNLVFIERDDFIFSVIGFIAGSCTIRPGAEVAR